jgi:hypothetical protein
VKTLTIPTAAILLLVTAGTSLGGQPEPSLTSGPTAVRDGDAVKISFGVSAPTDVEVAVLDAKGKVVRHLAAGLLGEKAPAPFKKGSLKQEVLWDGKGDYGGAVSGAKVRVRLGLRFGAAKALDVRPPLWRKGNIKRGAPVDKPAPDFTGKTAHDVFWLTYGNTKAYTAGPYLAIPTARLVGDPDTGHVYFTVLANREHWERWHRVDPEKGEFSEFKELPYASNSMAFGSDGLVYLFPWGWATWRMDRGGKPAPFPGTGQPGIRAPARNSTEVDAAGYGDGMGPWATCLGLDGRIYNFISHPQTGYARLQIWGRDGKLVKSGHIPFARARHTSNIRVDREGFLYVALNGLPEGYEAPPGLKPDCVKSFVGTIVKLRIEDRWTEECDPKAGTVPPDAAEKAAGAVLEGAQVSWSNAPYAWRDVGQGRLKLEPPVKVFVPDVEKVIPGISWTLPASMCSCTCPLMDMDRFGRLYVPDPALGRVRIMDSNGNDLAAVSKKLARRGGTGNLLVAWPFYVASAGDALAFYDGICQRAVHVKLQFAAVETAAIR